MNNEMSAIVSHDGEEINLFDTVSGKHRSLDETYEANNFEREFWAIIEDAGEPAEKVMRYLLSNNKSDLKPLDSRSKYYKADPLRDVKVSLDEVETIIADLRERFLSLPSSSACGQYLSSFLQHADLA